MTIVYEIYGLSWVLSLLFDLGFGVLTISRGRG